MRRGYGFWFVVLASMLLASNVDARFFRNGQDAERQQEWLPDMPRRLSWGSAKRIRPGSREPRHAKRRGGLLGSPALAALDSDGDGVSNGAELGDPEGAWTAESPAAGHPALASHPGDADSLPPAGEGCRGLCGHSRAVRKPGGVEIAVSRAIAGRSANYAWTATTDADGKASVTVRSSGKLRFRRFGASGYYKIRATDEAGDVVGRWSSIPVAGGNSQDLTLAVGSRASISGSLLGTPLVAAAKGTAITSGPTFLTERPAPFVRVGEVRSEAEGLVRLSLIVNGARNFSGGDLRLSFDTAALSLADASLDGQALSFVSSNTGVSLPLDGLYQVGDRSQLELVFRSISTGSPGAVGIHGLLLDTNRLPVSLVDLTAQLSTQHLVLHQNFPNPFNPSTQVRYDVPGANHVRLTVFNSLGQEVERLVDEAQSAGSYTVSWDARNFTSGEYFLHLNAGPDQRSQKMVLLK